MKELISNDLINRIRESKSNAEARRYILTALQKAKQKEAIEQSTNWQMKEEYSTGMKDKMLMPDMEYKQPELSAEEFLRSKMEQEDLKDYFANFCLGISGKRYYMKDLLTEFKNQNG